MGVRFEPYRDVEIARSNGLCARARTEHQRVGNTMIPGESGNERVHRRNVAQPGRGWPLACMLCVLVRQLDTIGQLHHLEHLALADPEPGARRASRLGRRADVTISGGWHA